MALHAVRDLLGHANVSQTSTYLSTTTTSLHAAMQQFEARQIALQPFATDAGTGGHTGAQTAAGEDERPNKTGVDRDQAIM